MKKILSTFVLTLALISSYVGVANAQFSQIPYSATESNDTTLRIAMWNGKVNQHIEVWGTKARWQTDHDGVSGANIDPLTYCNRYFPSIVRVEPYKMETINTWRAVGNTGEYPGTVMTYKCVFGTDVPTPTVTLSSPNGGETFAAGQQIPVTWDSTRLAAQGAMDIYLVSGSGVLQSTKIASMVRNTGSTTVTLPKESAYFGQKAYRLMIKTITGNVSDQSNDTFTITGGTSTKLSVDLKINNVDTPGTLPYKSKMNVSWTSTGAQRCFSYGNHLAAWGTTPYTQWSGGYKETSGSVDVYAAVLNPLSTPELAYQTPITVGIQCYGKDMTDSVNEEISVPIQEVTAAPSITVTSPNGGGTYGIGMPMRIAWDTTGYDANAQVTLQLITTAMDSGIDLVTTRNDGQEIVTIPSISSQSPKWNYGPYYKIRAKITNGTQYNYDDSDQVFSLDQETREGCLASSTTPSVTVFSPNGGEVYSAGQQVEVKWKTCNISATDKVRIDLRTFPFEGVNGVSLANTVNDGVEVVTLPSVNSFTGNPMSLGKNFKVSIWKSDYSGVSAPQDFSDNLFTIQSPVSTTCTINSFTATPTSVLSGGEATISWNTSGCGEFVHVSNLDGGALKNRMPVDTDTVGPLSTSTTYTLYGGLPSRCTVNDAGEINGLACGQPLTKSVTVFVNSGYPGSTAPQVSNPLPDPATGTAVGTFNRSLKVGMMGADVAALQTRLKLEGVYSGAATGYFGALTQGGVRNYQKKVGLPQVGNVGPLTLKSLNK